METANKTIIKMIERASGKKILHPDLLLDVIPEPLLTTINLQEYNFLEKHQGDYMGGSVHPHGKNWLISVYWEGKRYRIIKHPITREPFYSKRSAEKQLDYIRCEIDERSFNPKAWLPDSPLSTRIYCEEWLEIINVLPKTLEHSYRSTVKHHIIPFFRDKDIRKIRYNDIVKFKNYLFEKDLEKKSVYNYVNVLKKILRDAWRNEDIKSVPPFPELSIELPEIVYLTLEQQNLMIENIPEYDRAIFLIGMEYGLRNEELRALQKDCITDSHIIIRRIFTYAKGGDILRETTKTGEKGKRSLPLTEFAKEILRSVPFHLSPFVFVRKNGMPYKNKNLNRIWHEAERKTGIKCKLQNALRHSLGCQLLDLGVDEHTVQQIYGHTDSKMTKRYAKRSPCVLTEALEKRRKIIEYKNKIKRG